MRYTNCCKSTRKNKKCTRKDGKHFSLQRRFSKKKCIKGPVKGFTMRASCAPYKFCKQKGGAKKTRKLLPKLRKISYKNKKHHYRLKDPFRKRKLAIHEGVNREAKKTGKTRKKAAIAKKGRFNILRIYRKNKKIKECNTITHDMKYMDRKYGLGKTKNICGQKGGTTPILFRGKEELIQKIREQIGPDNEAAIFETVEYNFVGRYWENNKIYIKKDDLDEEAGSIPNYTIDDNDNVTNNIVSLPIDRLITGYVRIKKKDGEWFKSLGSQVQFNGGYKKKRDNLQKSILNKELQVCSKDPITGFTRDGYCRTNSNDSGSHLVCAKMDQQFLDYTKSQGNDLSSVVKDGENWCLCQDRWLQAHKVKKAPKVIKEATNNMIRDDIKTTIGQKGGCFGKWCKFPQQYVEEEQEQEIPAVAITEPPNTEEYDFNKIVVELLSLPNNIDYNNKDKTYHINNALKHLKQMTEEFDNFETKESITSSLSFISNIKLVVRELILKFKAFMKEKKNKSGKSSPFERNFLAKKYKDDYFGPLRFSNNYKIKRPNGFHLHQQYKYLKNLEKMQEKKLNRIGIMKTITEDEEEQEQIGGRKRRGKTRKKKKQFLYNPDDPSKSFDVYIDKNPNDTIPIKYTTVKDVKDTIKKLERLYKTKKYPHKRIWQVGMIMKVRLEAMLKHKTKKYPNAKKVKQRFNLANKYFKFLGKRTKKNDFKSRKAMTFKF
tara:strand:+ start:1645 stop:3792 length:2148 start_codon:yes stop_codon:yes gene_type:complete